MKTPKTRTALCSTALMHGTIVDQFVMDGSAVDDAAEELADELDALLAIYSTRVGVRRPREIEGGAGAMAATVRIQCGATNQYELCAELPTGYPIIPPLVSVGRLTVAVSEHQPVHAQEDEAATLALHAHMAAAPHPEAAVLFELIEWVDEWAAVAHAEEEAHSAKGGEHAASTETKRRTRPVTPEPIHRQWIWFIGFYTRSIIKAFCSTANEMGCTGFLMPGKPAVAAVEATAEVIAEFLKVTRTELFARVPPASRKMKLCLLDSNITARAFATFEEMELKAVPSAHKRKDIADLGGLESYLTERGLSHAFNEIFDSAVG